MTTKKIFETINLLCIAAGFALSYFFYVRFPDVVATHWNVYNQPDGYSSRAFAAFFFPFLTLSVYLLLSVVPKIDPRRERYQEFSKVYSIFKSAIVIFLFIIYILVGLSGIGYSINVGQIVSSLVGVLFIIIGNYMGKIKNNFFFGVRTPWTLSSEVVWNKTHRLSGKLFVLGGLALVIGSFFGGVVAFTILMITVLTIVFIPMFYSYVLYKNLKRE